MQMRIKFLSRTLMLATILGSISIACIVEAANPATEGDLAATKLMDAPNNLAAEEAALTKAPSVPEEVKKIINKYYPENFEISQWVLKPWIIGDLNGDGAQELAVLLRDTRERLDSGNAYPTHIAIFGTLEKIIKIKNIRSNLMIKVEQGMPARNQDSFRINNNAKYLKILGCPQPVAIEFYEEASTSFFLCWDGKNYRFFRDPTDEP